LGLKEGRKDRKKMDNDQYSCNRCGIFPPVNPVVDGDYDYCSTCLKEYQKEQFEEELLFEAERITSRKQETINRVKEIQKKINNAIYFRFHGPKVGEDGFFGKGNYS